MCPSKPSTSATLAGSFSLPSGCDWCYGVVWVTGSDGDGKSTLLPSPQPPANPQSVSHEQGMNLPPAPLRLGGVGCRSAAQRILIRTQSSPGQAWLWG